MAPPFSDHPKYGTVHKRLYRSRGSAKHYLCVECGEPAASWALVGEFKWVSETGQPYTDDLDAYAPMCWGCHLAKDKGVAKCPHGPEREQRRTLAGCAECHREAERRRYHEDPEHRQRVIERAKLQKQNKKMIRQGLIQV